MSTSEHPISTGPAFTPSRRSVLRAGVTGAAVGAVSLATNPPALPPPAARQVPAGAQGAGAEVFQHGVASGDPLPDSVLIHRATSHPAISPALVRAVP